MVYEVVSNNATTDYRKTMISKTRVIVRRPKVEITKKMNVTFSALEPYLSYYPEKIYENMYKTGVLAGASA